MSPNQSPHSNPIDCETAQRLIATSLDDLLSPMATDELSYHLAECAACRGYQQALSDTDELLASFGREQQYIANSIAESVAAELHSNSAVSELANGNASSHQHHPTRRGSLSVLLVVASTLMMALVALWIAANPDNSTEVVNVPEAVPSEAHETIAHINAATGPVFVRNDPSADWQEVALLETLGCSSGTSIRTGEASLCEVETESGGIVRLNRGCVVTFRENNSVSVESGEIYCVSSDSMPIEICTPSGAVQSPAPAITDMPIFCCPTSSACSVKTETSPTPAWAEVACSQGTVRIAAGANESQLTPGMSLIVSDGEIRPGNADDALLKTRWYLPLLALGRPEHKVEVDQRVNALLSRIGFAKASFLYEDQIRELGETGAWPLLHMLS
ncbi:MAG: zf-HC2 domain-containing protein, partial [Planctomycetaceae bacterium]|nr:zf-HC2 domain-containing protein [Planctomycetaceae bacterium]